MAQGLAGEMDGTKEGELILYYIILYYILLYIYIYYSTFAVFVQTHPPFLRTVFFFLIAGVEAGASKNAPSASLSPSLKISATLQRPNVYLIKSMT